jgi:ABC-2 type transport system ATP-binding protein
MENILSIKDLKKSFGEIEVVRGLNFDINRGDILGFLGPNGAGKSTTINMIAMLLEKESGKVIFDGIDVTENNIKLKKSLGLVPQDIALFSDLTAYENVKFFCSLYGIKGNQLREATKEALEKVGLWNRKDDFPDSFSGGMKRRLNIACSIAHKPKLLIMDEPTVGIDPQSRNNILEVVKELREEGTTIIYISHYMEEVDVICSKIIIMDKGKIIEEGDKEEIKSKYKKQGLNNLEDIFLYLTGTELRD